jgi:hypothetical protein
MHILGVELAASTTLSCAFYFPVDAKIQEIANSTTMQTVSSTLAVALAEAEASQSRSLQLKLGAALESKSSTFDEAEASTVPEKIPSPKQSPFTTKRLRDAVSYQIGGHCFRADDESSAGTPEEIEEDSHAKDVSLTRLQFVVTSVFGLREAARNKTSLFEHHASRLLMTSTGPNTVGGKSTDALVQYPCKMLPVSSNCLTLRWAYWMRSRDSRLPLLVQSRQSIPSQCRYIIFKLETWERKGDGFSHDVNPFSGS